MRDDYQAESADWELELEAERERARERDAAYQRALREAEDVSREDLEATSAWLSRMLEEHGHCGL